MRTNRWGALGMLAAMSALAGSSLTGCSADVAAPSAEEALAKMNDRSRSAPETRPYDLLIADIFLEGRTSGLDVWKICQNVYPEVALIVTSSLPVDKFLNAIGQEKAGPPFLPKPFSVVEVRKLFTQLLKPEDQV